jgi:hypothetical protein
VSDRAFDHDNEHHRLLIGVDAVGVGIDALAPALNLTERYRPARGRCRGDFLDRRPAEFLGGYISLSFEKPELRVLGQGLVGEVGEESILSPPLVRRLMSEEALHPLRLGTVLEGVRAE